MIGELFSGEGGFKVVSRALGYFQQALQGSGTLLTTAHLWQAGGCCYWGALVLLGRPLR